jgi:hypothetical protein
MFQQDDEAARRDARMAAIARQLADMLETLHAFIPRHAGSVVCRNVGTVGGGVMRVGRRGFRDHPGGVG